MRLHAISAAPLWSDPHAYSVLQEKELLKKTAAATWQGVVGAKRWAVGLVRKGETLPEPAPLTAEQIEVIAQQAASKVHEAMNADAEEVFDKFTWALMQMFQRVAVKGGQKVPGMDWETKPFLAKGDEFVDDALTATVNVVLRLVTREKTQVDHINMGLLKSTANYIVGGPLGAVTYVERLLVTALQILMWPLSAVAGKGKADLGVIQERLLEHLRGATGILPLLHTSGKLAVIVGAVMLSMGVAPALAGLATTTLLVTGYTHYYLRPKIEEKAKSIDNPVLRAIVGVVNTYPKEFERFLHDIGHPSEDELKQ